MSAKRAVDLVGSVIGLVIAALPMAFAAAVIRVTMGPPVLFRQERPGLHGQTFTMLKLRTMAPGSGTDDLRLTRVGRALRATSVDELPQLWNVLRGDMSLVGPRPLLEAYLDRYTPHHARRHEVRPGITGLAQVRGRNATTWETRLDLDVTYVDQHTIWLDLQILAQTVAMVVRRQDVSAPGHVTMPELPAPPDARPDR